MKKEYTAKFPAGRYYIGDLCYVMHKEWEEVINLMYPNRSNDSVEGELTLADGRRFFYGSTAWGDGEFCDNRYGRYPVDAGLIGIIAVDNIAPEETENLQNGMVYTFEEDFSVYTCGGSYDFGGVLINTDWEDEEEYEYDEEEEDEFWGVR